MDIQQLEEILHSLVFEHGLTAYDIAGDPNHEYPIVIDHSKEIAAIKEIIEKLKDKWVG